MLLVYIGGMAATPARLNERAREARGARSQAWVAQQMGTTQAHISRLERGDVARLSTLLAYAYVTGSNAADIITRVAAGQEPQEAAALAAAPAA
jgi:predicted transcriptional regulator